MGMVWNYKSFAEDIMKLLKHFFSTPVTLIALLLLIDG